LFLLFVFVQPTASATPGEKDSWGDTTSLTMNSTDSTSASSSSSSSASSSQAPPSFYFTIGSVENFERKLEVAQRECNIPPSNFIPVQYTTETSWYTEALKLAPSLIIIGGTIFLLRSAGGAGGGGGGMGSMFKIGKSNAKKVKKEDISVTFKDVAGCQEAKREIMEVSEKWQ